MLAAIRGEPTDLIPWMPRLDLWYRANKHTGSLPRKYRHASLMELTDDIGVGFHAVIPDFRDLRGPEDEADRGLGLYNLRTMPCHTVLEGLTRTISVNGDRTCASYSTPEGTIDTAVVYNDDMRRSGITISHIESHAFRGPGDYAALIYIFEHARVVKNADGYRTFAKRIGDRGIAVAALNFAASPAQFIMRDLMPLDTFYYEMHDRPCEFNALAQAVNSYYEKQLPVACEFPADVFLFGSNYDASITHPAFFAEHILPWLKRFSDALHGQEKYLLTHTDGENDGLLEYYLDAGVDIADSICPSPMTRLSLREIRDVFREEITVMGGIPSVFLLPSVIDEMGFRSFLDQFFEDIGRGDHLILGVSDAVPPDADFNRILEIGKRVQTFGSVR